MKELKQNIPNPISKRQQFLNKLSKIESEILEYMKNNKSDKLPEEIKKDWETIIVDLTTKLKFGKYKGQKLESIMKHDFSYILWLFREKVVKLDNTNKGLYYITKKILEKKYKEYTDTLKQELKIKNNGSTGF